MNYRLRTNPKCPVGDFPWEKYYWKRLMPDILYEDDYWGRAVDPDGNERNIMDEWDDQVENFRHIISYLDGYVPGEILDVGSGPGFFLSGLNSNWSKLFMFSLLMPS